MLFQQLKESRTSNPPPSHIPKKWANNRFSSCNKSKIKINTAYCDKFLRNTPRNLIWNNIDYILYNVVRRASLCLFKLLL